MIKPQTKKPKLLVIGDLMIDHYLFGSCERISSEAPVQIVKVDSDNVVLGGAGNVVNNLTTLGAQADVISVIGDDTTSGELKTLLKDININMQYLLIQQGRTTSRKSRIIAFQQQVVRFDRESTDAISQHSQDYIIQTFKQIISNYDLVLLSDYNKGVLTTDLTQSLINIANKNGKKVLVDPKGANYSKYQGAYLLTPNKKEASIATNINIKDDASLAQAISQLKLKCNLDVSLITMGEEGVAIFDDELRMHPTNAKEVFDVTGAGDTMIAALGFALACGYKIDDSIEFANLAAGVVVGKVGSATTTLNEIIEYESSANKSSSDVHIKTLKEITELSQQFKTKNKKIVFTNGCFDLLHAGHIHYLEAAKRFGDVLILGLNSDKSVTALKGKDRPINTQADRACLLAALEAVDYVVIFDEDTPYNLIQAIKPHTLVKGGDYEGKKVVGEDIVAELKLIKFTNGKSTTQTIQKIQQGGI